MIPSLLEGWPGDNAETKQFLGGIRETRTRLGGAVTVEPAPDIFIEAGYSRLVFEREGVRQRRHAGTVTFSYKFY